MTKIDAINALIMCQELMLFDPMTGETHELWQENRDNQDLYNACGVAIAALREQAERSNGCTHCQKPYVSIGGINEDKAIIYLGAERPYTKGNVEYLHHMDSAGRMNAFKVRHCPMCGKRLEEHHADD